MSTTEKPEKPIYVVRDKDTGAKQLVRATNQPQAYRHVAMARYEVKAATANDVASLMASGASVQDAGPQSAESAPTQPETGE